MWARIVIMWALNLPATVNGVTAEKVRRCKKEETSRGEVLFISIAV